MPLSIPANLLGMQAVQIVLIVLNLALSLGVGVWLIRRSIDHGERIGRVEAILTNHFLHRFERIRHALHLDWDDDLDNENRGR